MFFAHAYHVLVGWVREARSADESDAQGAADPPQDEVGADVSGGLPDDDDDGDAEQREDEGEEVAQLHVWQHWAVPRVYLSGEPARRRAEPGGAPATVHVGRR